MELMMQLTNDILQLRKTPNYAIFKKRKLKKDIREIEDKIRESDIFRASGAALSYFISTTADKDNCLIDLKDHGFLVKWTDITMQITLEDTTTIVFYPKLNKFLIYDSLKSYTIYRNTSTPKILQIDWNLLCERMKEMYIRAVYEITATRFNT